jgi:hypothetical protein
MTVFATSWYSTTNIQTVVISLLYMGCGFWGKMESAIANAESEKTLANTGEIKHCQRRQRAVLELQNRGSTTEAQLAPQFLLSPFRLRFKLQTV